MAATKYAGLRRGRKIAEGRALFSLELVLFFSKVEIRIRLIGRRSGHGISPVNKPRIWVINLRELQGGSAWIRRGRSSILPKTGSQPRFSRRWNGLPPCVRTSRTGESRWCGTKDYVTLPETSVQLVIIMSSENRKPLLWVNYSIEDLHKRVYFLS